MNHTNGPHRAHYQTVCPKRHPGCCPWLHTQTGYRSFEEWKDGEFFLKRDSHILRSLLGTKDMLTICHLGKHNHCDGNTFIYLPIRVACDYSSEHKETCLWVSCLFKSIHIIVDDHNKKGPLCLQQRTLISLNYSFTTHFNKVIFLTFTQVRLRCNAFLHNNCPCLFLLLGEVFFF